MSSYPKSSVPSTYWRVSAKVLIFDEQNRLLVFKASDGEWEMPGGGWEHDETYEQCVRRELAEEIGVGVQTIGPVLFVYPGKTDSGNPKINIVCKVEIDSSEILPTGDELVEAKYVSKEEFLRLPFSEGESPVTAHTDKIWL